MNEKQYLHDLISSDRRYPTVNANGPLYRIARVQLGHPADSRSGRRTWRRRSRRRCAIRRCRSASGRDTPRRSTPLQPSPYWGDEAHLGHARQQPQLDVRPRRPRCGWRRRCAAPENPAFCKAGSDHPSAKAFPIDRAVRHIAVFDPKTKKYTFVDTCFGTHHLQFGYDANDTLWTSGGGPVVGWLNTKMFDRDRRRGEVAGLDGARARHQRQRQARRVRRARRAGRSGEGHAHQRAVLRGDAEPGRRIDLGRGDGQSRRGRARRAGIESARDRARRDLQRADARLRRARRRHRQQGRRLGVARQRAPRQLRSAQVQGAAQRPEGDRRSLSRGLVVPPVSRARASRASARTAPSRAITRGSISTTRSASATTCRCRPAT